MRRVWTLNYLYSVYFALLSHHYQKLQFRIQDIEEKRIHSLEEWVYSKWHEGTQWAQTEMKDVLPELQQSLFYWVGVWAVAEIAQGSCGVFLIRDIQNSPGLGPGEPLLGGPAWTGRLVKMTFRGLFQTQPPCNSVLFWGYCVCASGFPLWPQISICSLFP